MSLDLFLDSSLNISVIPETPGPWTPSRTVAQTSPVGRRCRGSSGGWCTRRPSAAETRTTTMLRWRKHAVHTKYAWRARSFRTRLQGQTNRGRVHTSPCFLCTHLIKWVSSPFSFSFTVQQAKFQPIRAGFPGNAI